MARQDLSASGDDSGRRRGRRHAPDPGEAPYAGGAYREPSHPDRFPETSYGDRAYEGGPYRDAAYGDDPRRDRYAGDPYAGRHGDEYAPERRAEPGRDDPYPAPYGERYGDEHAPGPDFAYPDHAPAGPGPEPAADPPADKPSRAGRNLPMAIAVGCGLGAIVLASLLIYRPAFAVLVGAAVSIGLWELVRAMGARHKVPLIPLLAGGLGMTAMAWFGGAENLVLGLGLTLVVVMAWRLAEGPEGYLGDMLAATLAAVYVPFLAGFAVLLAHPGDGHLRVIATLALVVLSDTGGYVAGVLFGKHPMAPKVSPKKSWEGMGGSVLACAIGGALLLFFVFDVAWWKGALFGLAITVAATLGDLTESMIKRDLGVKDMSGLVPGHGGLMDRLDSILLAAPTAVVLLTALAPPA